MDQLKRETGTRQESETVVMLGHHLRWTRNIKCKRIHVARRAVIYIHHKVI